jgi:hypothetical protein
MSSRARSAGFTVALLATLAALIVAELLLTRFANPNSRPVFRFAGIHHDNREWLQALYDLRAAGVDAYPIVSAQVYGQFLATRNDDTMLLPLAGLSHATTTFCNELGDFVVFQSDRYGFRNDDRLWDAAPPVMLTGDSFGQGACVRDDATISAGLARAGIATISVAYNSNGPLAELASLVEYGPPVRPATVVWLYYEGNDLTDLGREFQFAALRKYLEPQFAQRLAHRQAEIDEAIKSALNARPEIQKVEAEARQRWTWSGVFGLRNVRALLSETLHRPANAPPAARELDDAVAAGAPTDQRLSDLEIVLTRAQEVVRGWGGLLVMAYLPATERYRFPTVPEVTALPKVQADVTDIATSLGIPVIDLGAALRSVDDVGRLFPKANWPVHFNEEGYRLVASALAERLRERSLPAPPD